MSSVESGTQSRVLPARELLLWLGLLTALSPILMDWALHLVDEPRAAYSALFVPLFAHLAWCDSRREPPRPAALWLLVAVLVFALVMVGGGVARYGRLALPLGLISLGVGLGRPRLPVALLSMWIVPVPGSLLDAIARRVPEFVPTGAVQLGIPALALASGVAYYLAVLRSTR